MANETPVGTDLAYDMRWFLFTGNQFKPEPSPGLNAKRHQLLSLMPCLVNAFEGSASAETRSLRDQLRKKMETLGFYKGLLAKRPEPAVLERDVIAKPAQSTKEDGQPLFVHVYTDPSSPGKKVTDKECGSKETRERQHIDGVHCVARHIAEKEAKRPGGLAIPAANNQGVEDLWNILERKSRRRPIQELHIYGHGAADFVLVGGDSITPETRPPLELSGRFSKGASIRLYGCEVAKNAAKQQNNLLDWFGNSLLGRGGTVTGFTAQVFSDASNFTMKLGDKVVRTFQGCASKENAQTFLQVVDEWVQSGTRLASSTDQK